MEEYLVNYLLCKRYVLALFVLKPLSKEVVEPLRECPRVDEDE